MKTVAPNTGVRGSGRPLRKPQWRTPSREIQRCRLPKAKKLLKGLDAAAYRVWGSYRRRASVALALLQEADVVCGLEAVYRPLSDRHLRDRLGIFREIFRRHTEPNERVLQHALAAVREAADRQLGMRPFPVQMAGALALLRGMLAEMATGEGKTLTAAVAAAVAAWRGQPCHVVTVNDYLAQRDAEWNRALYAFCGISAGYVTGEMDPARRREGYGADVTYCTGKEIVADMLRDRLRLSQATRAASFASLQLVSPRFPERAGMVMRGLHTAIVDEADCVMIDEAVTPVIISSPRPNDTLRDACRLASEIAGQLGSPGDYTVRARYREVELTRTGEARLGALCESLPGVWRGPARRRELIRQALTAREFFHEGRQYVVQDGKVAIVDEFTGRIMPQRTWREGLHQAVEAKQGLPISDPSETLARISFQRFFRLFARLSGMTGTAAEAADEFWHVYRLPVIPIPTNKPCCRVHLPDRIFVDEESKWSAVADEVVRLHQTGCPVLVGTRSVTASEGLSTRLAARGIEHCVLNAVRHKEEARIVAEAGKEGGVTIATNMAGRGTDIKLARGVAERGGLHVLATERHESQRIDRQLIGRSGRQGDPGSGQCFVCIDDEIIRRFLPVCVQQRLGWLLRKGGRLGRQLVAQSIAAAQANAQRMAARQRQSVLLTDTWMDDALSFAGEDL